MIVDMDVIEAILTFVAGWYCHRIYIYFAIFENEKKGKIKLEVEDD